MVFVGGLRKTGVWLKEVFDLPSLAFKGFGYFPIIDLVADCFGAAGVNECC